MMTALLIAACILLIAVLVVLALLWKRLGDLQDQSSGADQADLAAALSAPLTASVTSALAPSFSRVDASLTAVGANVAQGFSDARRESAESARDLRTDVRAAMTDTQSALAREVRGLGDSQRERLESMAREVKALAEVIKGDGAEARKGLDKFRTDCEAAITAQLHSFREANGQAFGLLAQQLREQLKTMTEQLAQVSKASEERLDTMRAVIDRKLADIQAQNEKKLEEMRATVDEKLQSTLDQRLAASFQQVSERLEQVHKGLGEMQALSSGVTDLRRVMTNVKARGTWAEYLLENLLQDLLAPGQYEANFKPKERGGAVVEFAVKLPGKDDDGPCWIPIDSKFPREDYERLCEAASRADSGAVEECARALEARVRQCARDIRDKYINPPRTTEWAILFLPTEGLYAEVLRRPGLVDSLQRDQRVMIAGPTTLAAYLNALCMGFQSLKVQKKSAEIGKLLGQVKTQFGAFGTNLAAVQKKLEEASAKLGDAQKTSERITKSLDKVEALPGMDGVPLITIDSASSTPLLDGRSVHAS